MQSEQLLEYWKQAISTQMHFNDLCVRSRQLGLTFVVAALGLNVVLLSEYPDARILIGCVNTHISALIMFIAAGAVLAVWHLDLGVYHKMLRGSVAFAEELDKSVMLPLIPNLKHGMTEFISVYSRYADVKYEAGNFSHSSKRLAGQKVRTFYLLIFSVILSIGLLIAFFVK
ncbi:hypothetical protein [Hyphomonas sp.]|uniref:hypothetical protein n=1 Tax=Hyphomonas sp. TaxID=87 RepID=UPI00391AAEFD